MLAPHIKKKVDKLWDRFWAAGLTNPLVAVEQITYLIFLKRLEDIDTKRAEAAQGSQRIKSVGGTNQDGTIWKLSQQEAIEGIERREWKFYVSVGGKSVWVIVATSRFGHKYLKT